MTGSLEIHRDGDVWLFTLARPEKRNALSADLVEALLAGVQEAHAKDARVLAFRGAGRNFSAGFDFTDVESASEGDLLLRFTRIELLLQALAHSPCLTLAFAHGRNFGAGVDLFAVCRRRFAEPEATFRMPGPQFGLVLGTRRFAGIVGPERARAILEEGRTFDAAEALAMGFVERTVEPGGWDAIVEDARTGASFLDGEARRSLYRALADRDADADLADLVRSAARHGLKDRIAAYLGKG